MVQLLPVLPCDMKEGAILDEVEATLQRWGQEVVKDYQKTTQGWGGAKPNFSADVTRTSAGIQMKINFNASQLACNKWRWLDEGTRPHTITPRQASMLRFFVGGRAGSTPGKLTTRPSVPGNVGPRFARVVSHPGTAARGWTKIICNKHGKTICKRLETAMCRAAKASGHAIV